MQLETNNQRKNVTFNEDYQLSEIESLGEDEESSGDFSQYNKASLPDQETTNYLQNFTIPSQAGAQPNPGVKGILKKSG